MLSLAPTAGFVLNQKGLQKAPGEKTLSHRTEMLLADGPAVACGAKPRARELHWLSSSVGKTFARAVRGQNWQTPKISQL